MKNENNQNYLCFLFPKIWQILRYFSRVFRWTWTLKLWGVFVGTYFYLEKCVYSNLFYTSHKIKFEHSVHDHEFEYIKRDVSQNLLFFMEKNPLRYIITLTYILLSGAEIWFSKCLYHANYKSDHATCFNNVLYELRNLYHHVFK